MGKPFDPIICTIVFCVGAGISTLMSISDGLGPYIFRRKMEKTRSMKGKLDRKVFISRQSRHSSFIVNMFKVLFPNCTLSWRVNTYVSRQGKSINRRNESTDFIKTCFNETVFYPLYFS